MGPIVEPQFSIYPLIPEPLVASDEMVEITNIISWELIQIFHVVD